MPAVFRRTPDPISASYTDSHEGRGADYDANFESLPFRAHLWEMEQAVLADLIGRTDARSALDLACGTGRISEILAAQLPGADVIGVDVAESMLEVARQRVPGVRFVRSDVRALRETVPPNSIDLATAFRFFPNADAALRADAVRAMAEAVRPGGYVLFNNHRNFWSPSYFLRRARSSAAPGAINREMTRPFRQLGFEVVGRHSLGVLPHTEARAYLVSEGIARRVESLNLRRFSRAHSVGTDTIWLMRKGGAPEAWVR